MAQKIDHWMEVCALAAQEQDMQKMIELTNEMLRLLDEEGARVKDRFHAVANAEAGLKLSPEAHA